MAFRELLRGRPPEDAVRSIAREVARRHDEQLRSVTTVEVDNWLSLPLVVNDHLFVKVLSQRNVFVHRLLTAGRNLGAASTGTGGFFGGFETPGEMAAHEFDATEEMIAAGVNAPEPFETFVHDGYGVVVMEYLDGFDTLDARPADRVVELVPELFAMLVTLHDAGLAHGDLRAENVLVVDGELYFIDATRVDTDAVEAARGYDIACALAALEPHVGPAAVVDAALEQYSDSSLLTARRYLDFVNVRPDHEFDAAGLKGTLDIRLG